MHVVRQRLAPTLVGQRECERQSYVVERKGRGAGDRARHVGHAIVNDAVLDVSGIRVRRRARRLSATALID